jgi:glycosyltransferase involved in cell wall biosynthesis
MNAPNVSVIIPAFNRTATIARAIRSVQDQSFIDWELIVVDDASTDETCAVVEAVGESRLRLVKLAKNGGPSVARQAGLEVAAGEYVAFLDSDDEWLPEKLARQLDAGPGAIYCGYFVRHGGEEWTFIHPAVDEWVPHLHVRCMLRAGSTLLVQRKAANAAGGFDPQLRYYEDWDLALRLAEREPVTVIPEPLARIHVGAPRSMAAAEPSIRHFLSRHDASLHSFGAGHRRRVRAQHLQNLAAGAFLERQFALGSKWLIESFSTDPLQNPARLAALVLAPVDALFGTRLIEKAAAGMRRLANPNAPKPAP